MATGTSRKDILVSPEGGGGGELGGGREPSSLPPSLMSGWKSLINTVEVGVGKGKMVGGTEIRGGSRISENITDVRGCFYAMWVHVGLLPRCQNFRVRTHPPSVWGWLCRRPPQAPFLQMHHSPILT